MKQSIKYIIIGLTGIVVALVLLVSFSSPKTLKAAQGFQIVSTNTTNPFSTTTLNYMTAGLGTTTLKLTTYNVDSVGLNILFSASSSASVLKYRYEYSVNNVDWYAESKELTANASTTVLTRDFAEYSQTFASSTGGTSFSSQATSTAFQHVNILNIASPYMRIIFYLPPGSTGGAVYPVAFLKQNSAN